MASVAELIISARYDLRDEDSTQYSDTMLLDYLNRGLRPMCDTLAMLRSDWVNTSDTVTLLESASSATLPTLFISPITTRISTAELTKKSVSYIREALVDSTAGEPDQYAIQGRSILFNREADTDYTVTIEFNEREADLTDTDDMPYADEFNDVLRQFIVLLGKNRNEFVVLSDAAIQDFFYQALFSKLVARNHVPNAHRTDF